MPMYMHAECVCRPSHKYSGTVLTHACMHSGYTRVCAGDVRAGTSRPCIASVCRPPPGTQSAGAGSCMASALRPTSPSESSFSCPSRMFAVGPGELSKAGAFARGAAEGCSRAVLSVNAAPGTHGVNAILGVNALSHCTHVAGIAVISHATALLVRQTVALRGASPSASAGAAATSQRWATTP